MFSTMTSKGQLTVPKNVRDRLNVRAGDKLEFLFDENGIYRIVPVTASLKALKGITPKPSRTVSILEMREAIESRGIQ